MAKSEQSVVDTWFSNLLGAVVVWFFLYESSGLSLEAVDTMYRDESVKPWQSTSYIPPGYASRYANKRMAKTTGADVHYGNGKATNGEEHRETA